MQVRCARVEVMQRGLLCKYFHELFWHEAFTILLDSVPSHRGENWIARLKRIDPAGPLHRLEAVKKSTEGLHSSIAESTNVGTLQV
jgi:hypothetical protein